MENKEKITAARKFAEHAGLDLLKTNENILEEWNNMNMFRRSIEEREGCPQFVFFEGPPSANGHPGIHHVLARAIKDTFNRYKTMKGFQVHRKAGWDTHGLPVELGVEKELGITKADIDNHASAKYISVAEYNAKCRENVMKFTAEWRELTEKMGYWVDLDNPYITYDNKYIETLWWLLKQLYDKGLLYKGYTIQPYSPAAGTGLSSHELNQPGCYRDVKDTTVTAQFEIVNPRPEMTGWGKSVFLAWTTTPWTLPSNTALCVGPKIDYVCVQTYNPYTGERISAIMAAARVDAYLNPDGEYLELETYKPGDKVIPFRIVGNYKGSDLVGMKFKQLMPWVKPSEKLDDNSPEFVKEAAEKRQISIFSVGNDNFVEMEEEAFRVIPGDYVTTEDGTGIVHIAPTFGADDQKVAKAAGIPSLFMITRDGETRPMVDLQGKYYMQEELSDEFAKKCLRSEMYSKYEGKFVKNAYAPEFNIDGKYDEKAAAKVEDLNIMLCIEMKQAGGAFRIEKHVHNYPHCWRTDKPVLYYPLDSWFIRSTACKERMVELNNTINWKPESTGTGRFGNWLENLNDWNLSRSRFWGTPLPIWRNKDSREEMCIGSLEELYNEIEKSVAAGIMKSNPMKDKGFVPCDYSKENYDRIDMHRPYVDDIVLVSETGKPLHRETDLIDVWFDSGSMPYAQIHYPFENKEYIDERLAFPADFINEGVDQTRGWFFTLHAIATMVFDSVAFKNVISTGLVLDAKGIKMSKHIGNVVNPFSEIKKNGADAVRFYMMTNTQPWDNLKYDPKGVEEVNRKFFGTLFNTYSFFCRYANVDGFDYSQPDIPVNERHEIDRWILSELNSLIIGVDEAMNDFEPTKAGRMIDKFVNDDLSNWYVRLNRKRFWGTGMSKDKIAAYQTLYTCLENVAKLLAPFAPFYADRLYTDLVSVTGRESAVSVHLAKFPTPIGDTDLELVERMRMAQKITSIVLALRRKVNIKVRQPLQQIMIPAIDEEQLQRIESVKDLVLSEVNVKELQFVEGQGILVKKVKCNFRTMGKKFGKLMKGIAAEMSVLGQEDIMRLENEGSITLNIHGEQVTVELADVEIVSEDIPGWLVSNEGNLTVALDVELTDSLRQEGMARELINRIQNIRKDSGFEITDRVNVKLAPNDIIDAAVRNFGEYIASQVLADNIIVAENNGAEIKFDDFVLNIKVDKI
ncbi:isoleucine--tRNA ligase [Prevotella sp. OH937_COT-195]|uniref:isoleucine--tRNA ligase n=1 Tax=Prevotella sp. OH937_COT-195 TaxID=2491051 RepID=UPI000F647955|nr:isoleucine--tRNA ligase [Prevotella sp. OH937_COT-195]RRD02246.1 isoleucine--tRNA ligase [Prevotella sp. OH937_COT-195]